MSKETSPKPKNETATASSEQPVVSVGAQYIKDLSFENPHSPVVLAQIKTAPKVSVSIDIKAENLGQDRYEVLLHMNAKAEAEEKTVYVAELVYAALTTARNIPPQNLESVLMIYVPGLIFPFARRVLADITREGGMPPLLLDSIDFNALYTQRKKAA